MVGEEASASSLSSSGGSQATHDWTKGGNSICTALERECERERQRGGEAERQRGREAERQRGVSRVSHSVALHQPKQGKEEWKVTCLDIKSCQVLLRTQHTCTCMGSRG